MLLQCSSLPFQSIQNFHLPLPLQKEISYAMDGRLCIFGISSDRATWHPARKATWVAQAAAVGFIAANCKRISHSELPLALEE
jgi:hypothetical protein